MLTHNSACHGQEGFAPSGAGAATAAAAALFARQCARDGRCWSILKSTICFNRLSSKRHRATYAAVVHPLGSPTLIAPAHIVPLLFLLLVHPNKPLPACIASAGDGSLVHPNEHLPGAAFALSAQKIWEAIRAQKDLNLPAHKVAGCCCSSLSLPDPARNLQANKHSCCCCCCCCCYFFSRAPALREPVPNLQDACCLCTLFSRASTSAACLRWRPLHLLAHAPSASVTPTRWSMPRSLPAVFAAPVVVALCVHA